MSRRSKLSAAILALLSAAGCDKPTTNGSMSNVSVPGPGGNTSTVPPTAAATAFQMTRPSPKIVGGGPADPAKWTATRIFAAAGSNCTATVIGPKTVLTAAHCVGDGAVGTIDGIDVKCDHHPKYGSDTNFDVALCLASSPISPTSLSETLVGAPGSASVGKSVTILGYGCTTQGGGDFGSLYVAAAPVKQASTQADPRYMLQGGASGCAGDSGGAGFDGTVASRRVLGVMESVNSTLKQTWQVDLAAPAIIAFVKSWGAGHAAQICGVGGYAANCRS